MINSCSSQACEQESWKRINWTCYSIVSIFNSWWESFFLYSLALSLSKTSVFISPCVEFCFKGGSWIPNLWLIYVLCKLASEGEVIEHVIRLFQSLIRDEDLSFFISWLSFYRRLLFLFFDVWNSVLREEAESLIYDSFMFFARRSNWTCYSIVSIFNSWWGCFFIPLHGNSIR